MCIRDRNKSLKTINNKKILTHSVCEKNKLEKILEEFKNKTKLLLISPETEFKSLNLYKKLNEKFILLNSSFKEIKVFSSKFKTYEALKKNKINAIKIEKELKENIQSTSINLTAEILNQIDSIHQAFPNPSP